MDPSPPVSLACLGQPKRIRQEFFNLSTLFHTDQLGKISFFITKYVYFLFQILHEFKFSKLGHQLTLLNNFQEF